SDHAIISLPCCAINSPEEALKAMLLVGDELLKYFFSPVASSNRSGRNRMNFQGNLEEYFLISPSVSSVELSSTTITSKSHEGGRFAMDHRARLKSLILL